MKQEIAEKWAEALESGQYTQHTGALANPDYSKHCCLGVLCELAILDGVSITQEKGQFGTEKSYLPVAVREWSGMQTGNASIKQGTYTGALEGYSSLVEPNDENVSFKNIAQGIREEWEHI